MMVDLVVDQITNHLLWVLNNLLKVMMVQLVLLVLPFVVVEAVVKEVLVLRGLVV